MGSLGFDDQRAKRVLNSLKTLHFRPAAFVDPRVAGRPTHWRRTRQDQKLKTEQAKRRTLPSRISALPRATIPHVIATATKRDGVALPRHSLLPAAVRDDDGSGFQSSICCSARRIAAR